MRSRAHQALMLGLAVLLLAAAAALLADPWLAGHSEQASSAFQRLTGGLGLGPTVRLSPDEALFDPRIGASCAMDSSRVPGGGWLGGAEACSVFPYRRPFVAGAMVPEAKGDDAQVP